MKKFTTILLTLIVFTSCSQTDSKEKIIEKYVTNCAKKYSYTFQMNERQKCLDDGLKIDSTIAYLWQQKAMPYFKIKKYEVGMEFIDKAVKYDKENHLPYRAFIKCIFAKTYRDAIIDFEECKKLYGNAYVMDHTYDFYIGLSYLQLNEFKKAELLLEQYVNNLLNESGEEWVHPTALFYLGISKLELLNYREAIIHFDRALKLYPNFSDVKFYKMICLGKLKIKDGIKELYDEYIEDSSNGFTINEDNIAYEIYPYQKKKKDK